MLTNWTPDSWRKFPVVQVPDYADAGKLAVVEKRLAAKSSTEKWLVNVLMSTEFKRWQAAPILKVSEHSFGRGRRYPLAHRTRL